MSPLSLKVATWYVMAQEELFEEAHEIIEYSLKEIGDCERKLEAFLRYAEPAYRLLEIKDPKEPLKPFLQYHRILGEVARSLKKLEHERDLSRILRTFKEEADTLSAWAEEGFSTTDRLLEYFWNSRVGQKLSDDLELVIDPIDWMRTFCEEHR